MSEQEQEQQGSTALDRLPERLRDRVPWTEQDCRDAGPGVYERWEKWAALYPDEDVPYEVGLVLLPEETTITADDIAVARELAARYGLETDEETGK